MRKLIDTLIFALWRQFAYAPIGGAETPEVTVDPASGEQPPAAEAEPPAAPEVDLSPLTNRMDQALGRLDSLEQRLPQAEPEAPEVPPEDELARMFAQPGDPNWDPSVQPPDPNDPNVALAIIRAEAQRAAQATLQPELERQAQERRMAEGEQLLDDYPELQDEQAATTLASEARSWAEDLARGVGNSQLAQQIVGEPAFLELVHLAAKTAERAAAETPPGQPQGEVTLESPGAGNPGQGNSPSRAEQIKAAGTPRGFWA